MPYATADLATVLSSPPHARPEPVIVDANAFITVGVANLRRPRETAMLGSGEAGRIRLLATTRVAEEVSRHLARLARERADDALELWRSRYRELVWWVNPRGPATMRVLDASGEQAERMAGGIEHDHDALGLGADAGSGLLVFGDAGA